MPAHGLVVQPLGRVEHARARVQTELLQAEWVGAAQEGKGQLVLLVLVGGTDPQDLGVWRRVLGHAHLVPGLGKLGPVVVGVDDPDQHLDAGDGWRRGMVDVKSFITQEVSFVFVPSPGFHLFP